MTFTSGPLIKHSLELEETKNGTKTAYVTWQVFITTRQFIKKNPKMGCNLASPGGRDSAARQFLFKNPIFCISVMSRLAATSSLPGDFWEFSRNAKIQVEREVFMHFTIYIMQFTLKHKF